MAGYQTLVAALLAVPLGLLLVKVVSGADEQVVIGPFGTVSTAQIVVPVAALAALVLVLPVVVGLLTMLTVRSAKVVPPRRLT